MTGLMSEKKLAEIEARHQAQTPGPYVATSWRDKEDLLAEVRSLRSALAAALCPRGGLTMTYNYIRNACAAYREALAKVNGIIENSQGVTGWHLNGDVATWDEFEETGQIASLLASPDPAQRVVERLKIGKAAIDLLRERAPSPRPDPPDTLPPGAHAQWCPQCLQWIPGVQVTKEGWCICGTYLGDENSEWGDRAAQVIAAYDKEGADRE